MKLIQIPPDITDKVWPVVEPYLKKAIEFSHGTHSLESSRERVKSNAAQLWAIIEDEKPHKVVAAGLTSVTQYPTGKRAVMIELLGGERMSDWFALKKDVELWAAQNDCHLVYCWARKGWAKHLPDYHLSHYVLSKELH